MLTRLSTNYASGSTLTYASGTLTLTVSVNVTNELIIGSYTSTAILTGQVVATAPASEWPLLIGISVSGGQVNLSWPSLPGQSFTVQTAQELPGPWSTALGTTNVSGITTTWTAPSTPDVTRFYRVVASC